ncbi:hypothetical protein C4588_02645 [Candidatus Parcubacteria bacterium]|nr:MAG: hypothetical protein C4588_02645 [Candidatus Parcubacteria bacterium]
MTVINAIRFDDMSGAMVSDEERTLDMKRTLCSIDKIKHIIPERIQKEYGLTARFGTTGTCSVGSELKYGLLKDIDELYEKEIERLGRKPDKFKTLEDIAFMAFEKLLELKHKHVNEILTTRYGFDTKDLIRGYYMAGDEKIDIKDKEIIKAAEDIVTFTRRSTETDRIFINLGIIAGLDEQKGFQIFHLSLLNHTCEPVQSLFKSDGSGQDVSNIDFIDYIRNKKLSEKRGRIDPVEGMIQTIEATLHCHKMNIGIGGYLEIVYFDGREKDHMKKMKQFDDNRSKLACEIVDAFSADLISKDLTFKLIEDLLFKEENFEKVHEAMMKKSPNQKKLKRYLRGYKV